MIFFSKFGTRNLLGKSYLDRALEGLDNDSAGEDVEEDDAEEHNFITTCTTDFESWGKGERAMPSAVGISATGWSEENNERTSQKGSGAKLENGTLGSRHQILPRLHKEAFVEWRNEQGGIVLLDNEERLVRKFVRDTLFSKVKFITCDSELEYKGE